MQVGLVSERCIAFATCFVSYRMPPTALSNFRRRVVWKSGGRDENGWQKVNVTAEMLKASGNIAVTFFTQLFNKIFSEGVYPEQWSRSVIIPLFKKGDRDIQNSYRGISLLSVASK